MESTGLRRVYVDPNIFLLNSSEEINAFYLLWKKTGNTPSQQEIDIHTDKLLKEFTLKTLPPLAKEQLIELYILNDYQIHPELLNTGRNSPLDKKSP